MDDLQNYRSRIGQFVQRGRRRMAAPHVSRGNTTLTLLILISLATWTIANDPRIETNPGPGYSSQSLSMTKDEFPIFKSIRKINSNIAASASQRFFLQLCRDRKIIPRGYRSKYPVATPNPSCNNMLRMLKNYCVYNLSRSSLYQY